MRENCVEIGVLQLIDWRKRDNQNENLAEVVDVRLCRSRFSLTNLKPVFQTKCDIMQVQTKIKSDADELSPISASEVSINQQQKLTMLKIPKSS